MELIKKTFIFLSSLKIQQVKSPSLFVSNKVYKCSVWLLVGGFTEHGSCSLVMLTVKRNGLHVRSDL